MAQEDVLTPSTVEISGVPITYYDSGDDRGSDEVIVLVHGTGGSTRAHFGFVFPTLAAKQRVVSVDWADPGPADEPLELEHLVAQVHGVIEHVLPGRRVVLVGYSLGAVVALALAARHPDVVGRLVVASGWLTTDLQQLLRNDVWGALRRQSDDTALREYSVFCAFGGPFLAMRSRADVEPYLAAMAFTPFGDKQMELNRRVDVAAEAERVQAPTLVIGCSHDQMVPLAHQRLILGAVPDARLAVIETGHAVVFERPSELAQHIQAFVSAPESYPVGEIIPASAP